MALVIYFTEEELVTQSSSLVIDGSVNKICANVSGKLNGFILNATMRYFLRHWIVYILSH